MDRPNSVSSGDDAQEPHQARIARRYKVFEATRMTSAGGEARVHLINLSLTGALTGVEMGLRAAGIPHREGGVNAAMRFLAETG